MPKQKPTPLLKWTGTAGNDTALVSDNDALSRTIYDGASGYDTLDLSALTSGISLEILMGKSPTSRVWSHSAFTGSWWDYRTAQLSGLVQNTIKNFEMVIGTGYNDYLDLRGGTVARVVDGGAGDDSIQVFGRTGTSTAIGGLGKDQLFGSLSGDLLIGGTYVDGVAPGDDTRDEFEAYAGTILDFEIGVDTLYIDASSPSGWTTSAVWTDVSTSYGDGAQLVLAADRIITLVGVTADEMNAIPKGYVFLGNGNDVISGAGDDFIFDTTSDVTVESYIFPSGSGDDELAGFDVHFDTLVFASAPVFTEVDYHGEAALLATYDGGASSVLLIGLSSADQANLHIELLPPDPLI